MNTRPECVVEIARSLQDGTLESLGTGVIVSQDSVASVHHVVRACDASELQVVEYLDGENHRTLSVERIIYGNDDRDALVMLVIAGRFNAASVASIQNAKSAESSAVTFCGYARGNPVARLVYGNGWLFGRAPVRNARDHWIQINTTDASKGMSGGPVWHPETGNVVGFVTEGLEDRNDPDKSEICYALNAIHLIDEPFLVPFSGHTDVSTDDGRQLTLSDVDGRLSNSALTFEVPDQARIAPNFVGRNSVISTLKDFWTREGRNDPSILVLFGLPGSGKSAVIETFRKQLKDGIVEPAPDFVLEHSFDQKELADGFFDELRKIWPPEIGKLNSHTFFDRITPFFDENRILVVLDAAEVHQNEVGDLTDANLAKFVDAFQRVARSKLIIVSQRAPSAVMMNYTKASSQELNVLSTNEAIELYKSIMGAEPPERFQELCSSLGFLAQPLALIINGLRTGVVHGMDEALEIVRLANPEDDKLEVSKTALYTISDRLTHDQLSIIMLASLFSGPFSRQMLGDILKQPDFDVTDGLFDRVSENALLASLHSLKNHLLIYRSGDGQNYEMHQFIRRFFRQRFRSLTSDKQKRIHLRVAEAMRNRSSISRNPTALSEVDDGFEIARHLCLADQYNTAHQYLEMEVQRGKEYVVTNVLGAASAYRSVMRNFFPDGDFTQEPLVERTADKLQIMHIAGYCESVLGRPDRGMEIISKSARGAVDASNPGFAVECYRAAAYCAVSAGALNEANSLLEEASNSVASLGQAEEQFKLFSQQVETAHMTKDADWQTPLKNMEDFASEHFVGDYAEFLPRGTSLVHVMTRLGRMEFASDLCTYLLRRAEARGWIDMIERYRSLRSVISNDEQERRTQSDRFSTAVERVQRADLVAEIVLRRVRYLISCSEFEQANSVLNEYAHVIEIEGFSYLSIDLKVTKMAARQGGIPNFEKTERWGEIEQSCRRLGYRWGISDIYRYISNPTAALI